MGRNYCGKNKFQNHPNIECFHQSFSLISSLHVCSLDFTKLGSRELVSLKYNRVESLRLCLKIKRIPFPLHSFYLELSIFNPIFKLNEKWSYPKILTHTPAPEGKKTLFEVPDIFYFIKQNSLCSKKVFWL